MDREQLLLWVDRLAAGRQAAIRIDDAARTDPRTRIAFTRVTWLLLAEFVTGAGALAEAITLSRAGDDVSPVVWWWLMLYDTSDLGGPFQWQRVGVVRVIEVGPPQRSLHDLPVDAAGDCRAGPSTVLVDAVSSVSTGQLRWQNDRTGQVGWQRADVRVTGQSTPPPRCSVA